MKEGFARARKEVSSSSPEAAARALALLQADLRDSLLREEGALFPRLVEDLASSLVRAVSSRPGSWVSPTRAFAALLLSATRRAARAGVALPWDQSTVQGVAGAVLRLATPSSAASAAAPELLRAVAAVLFERGHMLGKETQDGLVAVCLKHAKSAVVQQPTVVATIAEDVAAEEDARDLDDSNDAVVASSSRIQFDECLVPALQCLHALAHAKRKSHFVEAHLKAVAEVALAGLPVVVANVSRGGGIDVLSALLQLIEALIVSGGSLFATLFGARVHSLTASMSFLLFCGTIRPDEQHQQQQLDGFSSNLSESGSARLSPVDRVRLHVVVLLTALANSCFKQFSNDMLTLLPFSTKVGVTFETRSLYSIILSGPCLRVRMHAILLLHAMLKPARAFFAVALDTDKQGSFISFSQKLALTLRDIHAVVYQALLNEEDAGNKTLLLRLVPVLVGVTPYDRLNNAAVELPLLPVLNQVAALPASQEKLSCVLGVLRVKTEIAQVRQWIVETKLADALAGLCFGSPFAEQAEACLLELCVRYTDTVSELMLGGNGLLMKLLSQKNVSVEVLQCALELAQALVGKDDVLLTKCWQCILQVGLSRQAYFFSDSISPVVSSVFVLLLASVPALAWAELPARAQVSIVAAVTSTFDESCPLQVRVASLRGVGQLLMLDELVRDNERFVSDASSMINAALSSNEDDEFKGWAYWALGNLSQALCVVVDEVAEESGVGFRDMLMLDALERAISGFSKSHDEKARCSCLRVLGKAASRMDAETFSPFAPRALAVISAALDRKEKAKVRWNACNALSLMLDGVVGKMCDAGKPWPPALMVQLQELLSTSTNYKERISAIAVLEKNLHRTWLVKDGGSMAVFVARLILAEMAARRAEKVLAEKYESNLRAVLAVLLKMLPSEEARGSVVTRVVQDVSATQFQIEDVFGKTTY